MAMSEFNIPSSPGLPRRTETLYSFVASLKAGD